MSEKNITGISVSRDLRHLIGESNEGTDFKPHAKTCLMFIIGRRQRANTGRTMSGLNLEYVVRDC